DMPAKLPRTRTDQLQRLRASLPKSLEIQARQLNNKDRLEDEINLFQEELKRKGYIELEGFWDNSFEKDVFSLSIGSTLHISPDVVGGRIHALIAHTERGEAVGVITNATRSLTKYYEFVEALIMALNKSRFLGEYVEKMETYSGRRGDET